MKFDTVGTCTFDKFIVKNIINYLIDNGTADNGYAWVSIKLNLNFGMRNFFIQILKNKNMKTDKILFHFNDF